MTARGAVRPAVARAPGKAILCGEHFVVHGAAAVACAIGRHVTARAGPLEGKGVGGTGPPARVATPLGEWSADEGGFPSGLPAPLAAVCRIAASAAGRAGAGLRIDVDGGGVPLGSGLGSSSAWCVAAAAAARAALGEACGADVVAEEALAAERGAFGRASGIDTEACARGGFGSYRSAGGGSGEKGWRPVKAAGCGLRLVVADTGRPHSTAEMVAAVARFRDANRAEFDEMAGESEGIARRAELAVGGGDVRALGRCMSEGHALLSRLGVSTREADELAGAAEEAGSPGAKITGAGGGGCVVALPGPGRDGERAVEEAVLSAGAAGCFAADAGAGGVRAGPAGPRGMP